MKQTVVVSNRVDLVFRAFADRNRLRILHLLQGGEMCVGDIVDVLQVPQPRVSRHLAYLRKAGLVQSRKAGLWNYYSLAGARNAFHQELATCLCTCFCDAPEIKTDAARAERVRKSGGCCSAIGIFWPTIFAWTNGRREKGIIRKGNSMKPVVLFLCTANSARSQMAEAFLKKLGGDRFDALSAGLEPTNINPLTTKVMTEVGIDMTSHYPKSVSQFLGKVAVRYVISVCEHAERNCPTIWPGALTRLSWPLDDPAACEGTEEERLAKFRQIRDQIEDKIKDWLKAP